MHEIMIDSEKLKNIASGTLESEWESRSASFFSMMMKKSKLVEMIVSSKQRSADQREAFFSLFLHSRRYRRSILAQNDVEMLDSALDMLLDALQNPDAVEGAFTSLKGAPQEVFRDVAYEAMHFLHPAEYCLSTRWVWNPLRGTGALKEVILCERRDYDFTIRQKVLHNVLLSLGTMGYVFRDTFPLDMICVLHYSQEVVGAKDNSMNAGGMEALFPNNTTLSMMILGIRGLIDANP